MTEGVVGAVEDAAVGTVGADVGTELAAEEAAVAGTEFRRAEALGSVCSGGSVTPRVQAQRSRKADTNRMSREWYFFIKSRLSVVK